MLRPQQDLLWLLWLLWSTRTQIVTQTGTISAFVRDIKRITHELIHLSEFLMVMSLTNSLMDSSLLLRAVLKAMLLVDGGQFQNFSLTRLLILNATPMPQPPQVLVPL